MFRFSLQTLFGVMILAAVVLAALFALPLWAGCWLLLVSTVILGAAAGAGGWYAQEGTRTFCAAVFLAGAAALWLGQTFPATGLTYQPVHAAWDRDRDGALVWEPVWRLRLNTETTLFEPYQEPLPNERLYQFQLLSIWGLALLAGVSACVVRACCLCRADKVQKRQEPASQPALTSP